MTEERITRRRTAYSRGIDAGHKYFRDGVGNHVWNYPDVSPYGKYDNPELNKRWWSGFHDGGSYAEQAHEA